MAFTDSADNEDEGGGAPPGPQLGPGGPPTPGPQGGAQGGPILAALARRGMSPPVSTPGPGNMAQGLMMLKQAVDMIHSALPNLEAGSPPHKDAIRALTAMTRHLPQGAPTAGVQQTQIGDLLPDTVRNALLQKIMAQKQQGGGAPGGAGGAAQAGAAGGGGGGGGGMPAQPTPSTPLPGA